jgi:hypothetical protein
MRIRIRDEKILVRDNHPGSSTLLCRLSSQLLQSLIEYCLPYFSLDAVGKTVPVFDCSHCEGMISDVRSGLLGNQTLHTCHPSSPCSGIVVRHRKQDLVVF